MKTKIIYISGNEVFNMADIRAAFDEVRATLGLGRDTVMFGVPVDNDDALGTAQNNDNYDNATGITTVPDDVAVMVDDTKYVETVDTMPMESGDVVQNETIPDTESIQPVKSTERKARTRTTKAKKEAPVNTETDLSHPAPEQSDKNDEKIIPILSVLAAKQGPVTDDNDNNEPSDNVSDTEMVANTNPTVEQDDNVAVESDDVPEIPDIDINADFSASDDTDERHDEIANMITDDAPDAPIEKTLEQLLESMTPLREDAVEDITDAEPEINEADDFINELESVNNATESDADATLEQLAAEFAENQDKIVTPQKVDNHSKIGKLKNILPFKKAKRDDSGLMGDLFGWAGIAANDDDFSIPGFFTKAASKK